tara:strand:- start:456 stop:749 length:294 start_codon:yes stop_codon:yes gene_type:complete
MNMKSDGKYTGNRNFDKEATDLLKGLSENKLYQLFDIVHKEMKGPMNPERKLELQAVKRAIRRSPWIESYKIDRLINGYQSEMARTGKPRDGQKTLR